MRLIRLLVALSAVAVLATAGSVSARRKIWLRVIPLSLTLFVFVASSPADVEATPDLIATIDVNSPSRVAINEATDRAYVIDGILHRLLVIDQASHTVIDSVPVNAQAVSVGVNEGVNRIYVVSGNVDLLTVLDGVTHSTVATPPTGDGPSGIVVDEATNRYYLSNNVSNTVSVFDGTTNGLITTIPVEVAPSVMAVDSGASRIYVLTAGGVSVIDASANQQVATIPSGGGNTSMAIDLANGQLFVVHWDTTISVIDLNTYQETARLYPDGSTRVAVDPVSGELWAVAGGLTGLIYVYDSVSLNLKTTLQSGNPWWVSADRDSGLVYVSETGPPAVRVFSTVCNDTNPADADGDSVVDGCDNCPTVPNAGQTNFDGDGAGDACDSDDDNDGVLDGAELAGCSLDPDCDNDGVSDGTDNCVRVPNASQANDVHPLTSAGDDCEDPDVDGVLDVTDNCPDSANVDQEDSDWDGQGDACDVVWEAGDLNAGIDVDVTSNTATSLGPIDVCRSAGVGTNFQLDVFVLNAPTLVGFEAPLYYDPGVLRVTQVDVFQMFASGGGQVMDLSGPGGPGSYLARAVELTSGRGGTGVLARVTLEALAAGVSPVALGRMHLINSVNEVVPGIPSGAIIYAGQPCPPAAGDSDMDGAADGADACPFVGDPAQGDRDADGYGDWCDDGDADNRLDVVDNCPKTAGYSLLDADGDGLGDGCDADRDGDGVPNVSDNAPNIPNPDQADTDSDSVPDVLDLDLDGDGMDDKTLTLSVSADIDGDGDLELVQKSLSDNWNGYWEEGTDWDADADEVWAQVVGLTGSIQALDLDGDGENEVVMKDPGQAPGLSQTYDVQAVDPDSDIDVVVLGGGGQGLLIPLPGDVDSDGEMESMVWEPELSASAAMDSDLDLDGDPDARWQNAQAAGIDNCPTMANAGQANYDGDAYGDACDLDDDSDGYGDVAEAGAPLCGNGVNDDGVVFGGSDDGVADDGCPGGPAQVGAYSEAQFNIGSGDQDPCGGNGWPAELVSGGASANLVNLQDLASFVAPIRRLSSSPGQAGFSSRWDLVPGHPPMSSSWITLQDMAALVAGPTAAPPMLGGAKAFNGPVCPWAP